MDVFRDILDKQLLDRKGIKMGKVDGLVMTMSPRARPRIAFIEIGGITLARRLGPRTARLVARLGALFGGDPTRQPFRVASDKIRNIGVDIELTIDIESTPLNIWHERLRRHILNRMP
jgi:hypothetical protein